uniref:Bifunctional inhibitor/plant lipid transfer protein/seed storage helical domain-containing protein n=1 Tax=Leersia perrieri TaxID=77586 RepID=A0A0D9W4S1_9ORYZ
MAVIRGVIVVAILVMVAVAALVRGADGAGECGATSPDKMALKLAPCASAAKDPKSTPSSGCCTAVRTIGKQSPKCLCAVMLSNTTRSSGIKPEVAITIPKRCNIADRPVGYKCGDYTLP